ncbi:DUF2231 domain-containing protein [Persephonella sp.]
MELNLVHAFFGRFGVLIPLLALFFEIGALITQKELMFKLSGYLVIFGCFVATIAGLTGFLEYSYLKNSNENVMRFSFHIVTGSIVTALFSLILVLRSYLLLRDNERIATVYIFLYLTTVITNLISNEIIIHTIRGE